MLMQENIYGVLPRRKYFSQILEFFCKDGMPTQALCVGAIFMMVGDDHAQFNTVRIKRR